MKQHSINTFEGGLNYDLNPLTTPNNVLTDAVNATFLTFNGDELVLQNDAGNTRILVPGTDNEFVTLNEGFYPIGLKEYGGVLYIISAKTKEDNSAYFNLNTLYPINFFVYNIEKTLEGDYKSNTNFYRAKENNQNKPLPLEGSNENWELIGNFKDYINYNSEIQFGSYPSPEAGGPTNYAGKDVIEEGTPNLLYKSKIINDSKFKSGRYINFTSIVGDTEYISCFDDDKNYFPKFYKVKLLHQMTNGFIDLTEDIWKEFIKHKTTENKPILNSYWFNDSEETFRYYCPHQYKGKLAISLEIEELKTFQIWGPTLVDYNSNDIGNEYTFTLFVKVESFGYVDCNYVEVSISVNGEPVNTSPAEVIDGIATFIIKRPESDREKLIEFSITPKIYFENNDITDSIPKEYINKFTIKGTRILTSEIDFIKFAAIENDHLCDPQDVGFGWYTKHKLVDGVGNNLDNNLTISEENEYIFALEGTLPEQNQFVVAYYNIINNKPVVLNELLPINSSIIESFERLFLRTEIRECLYSVTINFNLPIGSNAPIIFKTSSRTNINYGDPIILNTADNKTFTGYFEGSFHHIELEINGYKPISEVFLINQNTTLNYALISDVGRGYPGFSAIVFNEANDYNQLTGTFMSGVWNPNVKINNIVNIRGNGHFELEQGYLPINVKSNTMIRYLTPSEFDVTPVTEGYNLMISRTLNNSLPRSLFSSVGITIESEGTYNGQIYSILNNTAYNNLNNRNTNNKVYVKIFDPISNDFYVFNLHIDLLTL